MVRPPSYILLLAFAVLTGAVGCERASVDPHPPSPPAITLDDMKRLVAEAVASEFAKRDEAALDRERRHSEESQKQQLALDRQAAERLSAHIERTKQHADLLMTQEERKRYEAIRAKLEISSIWELGQDDREFACYGVAAPLLTELVAAAANRNLAASLECDLAVVLGLNTSERIKLALRRDEPDVGVCRAAHKLKAGMTLDEFEYLDARDEPLLKDLLAAHLDERIAAKKKEGVQRSQIPSP